MEGWRELREGGGVVRVNRTYYIHTWSCQRMHLKIK